MENEVRWLFRVNGKSFDEWVATKKSAGGQSFDDAMELLVGVNGTRSSVRPTNGRLLHITHVDGMAINGGATRDTAGMKTPLNGTTHPWESAADQPRVVCWALPPTEEQLKQERQDGVTRFLPSSGPHWQGRHGRRPSP